MNYCRLVTVVNCWQVIRRRNTTPDLTSSCCMTSLITHRYDSANYVQVGWNLVQCRVVLCGIEHIIYSSWINVSCSQIAVCNARCFHEICTKFGIFTSRGHDVNHCNCAHV